MAKKRIKPEDYIDIELELAESQLSTYKSWLDANPYDSFIDRIEWKQTSNGGSIPMVVATRESQQKNHRETLKDFLSLTSVVKQLRETEEKKKELRKGFTANSVLDDE